MHSPRSLLAKLAGRTRLALLAACFLVLVVAVPVFAANSFDSSNTGDATGDVTVNKPAGLAVGDVMIASVAYWGPSSTTITAPGWTEINRVAHTQPNPDLTLVSFWNEADAADVAAANFTFDLSTNTRAFGGIARYDDVVTTGGSPVVTSVTNPIDDDNPGASTSLNASSVTTTEPGQYVTAIYALTTGTAISSGPTAMSPLYNNGRTSGSDQARLAAYDVSEPVAGASTVKVATAAASTRYVSHTIALKTEPTKLGFGTSPHTGVVDECLGPITVQTQNTAGGATKPLASTNVDLTTDGTGSFFSDNGCTAGVTGGTIGTNATGFNVYYKPTDRGTGSHTITAEDAAGVLTQAQQTQTVKLAQTINWLDVLPASAIYGNSFDVGTATATSGLDVTIAPSGGCSLAGSDATVTSATTDCTLTATQAGDSTYAAAAQIQRTVTTDPRPITVTPDSGQSKVYNNGASNPTYTYDVTSGDLVGTDTLSGALARTAGENVSTSPYAINQGTLAAGSNYDLTFTSGVTFAITPRPLSMNANDDSKTYGDLLDPTLNATLSGFAAGHNNRSQAGVSGTESCTRDPGETVAGSPYEITCAQGTLTSTNGNYSFVTGTSGAFTIDPAVLDVDANPASKTYGDTDPPFTSTLTGFVNSEDASSAGVTGTAACSRAGSDTDIGTYVGDLSCIPDTLAAPNYTFVAGAVNDFTIDPRTAHVTSTIANKTYDRTPDADIVSSVLTNRAPGETAAEVDFTGGTFSAVFDSASAGQDKAVDVSASPAPTLTGTEASNYTLVIDDATADINPKSVDGSFTAADKVYNGITAATVNSRSVDAVDVISPDVVSLVGGSANFANPNAGNGKTVTLTGASASNPNYTVGTVATDTANITKRNVTGSFTAADKDFDGTRAAAITSRSLENEVPGDAVALTGGTATFSDANPGADKTVTGTGFGLGGSDAPNYNLTGVGTTTATISRQPAGNTPPPKDVTKDAKDALGTDVKELAGVDLNGLGFAFAPADQTNTLRVGTGALKLFAIGGCDTPCTVNAKKTIVLTTAGASAAGTKKLRLKAQNLSLAAGEFGVVKLKKLTRKQRKAIKKADKAKLIVKVTLQAGAEQVAAKKKYKLKLKKS